MSRDFSKVFCPVHTEHKIDRHHGKCAECKSALYAECTCCGDTFSYKNFSRHKCKKLPTQQQQQSDDGSSLTPASTEETNTAPVAPSLGSEEATPTQPLVEQGRRAAEDEHVPSSASNESADKPSATKPRAPKRKSKTSKSTTKKSKKTAPPTEYKDTMKTDELMMWLRSQDHTSLGIENEEWEKMMYYLEDQQFNGLSIKYLTFDILNGRGGVKAGPCLAFLHFTKKNV